MNAYEKATKARKPAADLAHLVLSFDNNRLATALFGQFDENLALIEQQLGVDMPPRAAIQSTIKGAAGPAPSRRQRALEHLYARLQKGDDHRARSDVDGAIRMASQPTTS